MKEIEELYDQIEDEMDDAEKYIRCAEDKKDSNPTLAELYYTLSLEEMKHMKMLHDQVVAIIENYKKTNGPPSDEMMGRYKQAHKMSIKHATKIKAMQAVYKQKE